MIFIHGPGFGEKSLNLVTGPNENGNHYHIDDKKEYDFFIEKEIIYIIEVIRIKDKRIEKQWNPKMDEYSRYYLRILILALGQQVWHTEQNQPCQYMK